VGINGAGEITIADNHNNFNLSVFSQDGQLISALESKVWTRIFSPVLFIYGNLHFSLMNPNPHSEKGAPL
jgi:hypothetical protein